MESEKERHQDEGRSFSPDPRRKRISSDANRTLSSSSSSRQETRGGKDEGEESLLLTSLPSSSSSSSSSSSCAVGGLSLSSAHLRCRDRDEEDGGKKDKENPGVAGRLLTERKHWREKEVEVGEVRKQEKEIKKKGRRNFLFRYLDRDGEEELHPNIYLMFYFRMLNALAYAARAASIFDSYLHLKFGGNKVIGTLTSFSGVITILVAPLAGFVSDRFKLHRSQFLRFSAIFALACIYVNWLAVSQDDFSLFLLTTFMWKGWYEFVTVCTESLFNDSIPQGRRSELYVHRRIVTTLANGVGPLFSLLVFFVEGNAWNLSVLHTALHVGIILSLPQAFVLWLWEDVLPPSLSSSASSSSCSSSLSLSSASLEKLSNEIVVVSSPKASQEKTRPKDSEEEEEAAEEEEGHSLRCPSSLLSPSESVKKTHEERLGISCGVHTPQIPHLHEKKHVLGDKGRKATRWRRSSTVPWLVFISHCITFSGAGMTVKYFPLFFKSEYQLQPIHMCLLSSVYTLFIAFFTFLIQRMATRLGRPQASLLSTGLGISCLFLLSYFRYFPLVVLVYLLRGALQNASTPIDRSLVMDFISPKHVGKWSALQSLSTMMWSLSALLGGFLVDQISYRQTFIITGCVYILAELVYLPVLWLVPRELDILYQSTTRHPSCSSSSSSLKQSSSSASSSPND